MEDYDCDLSAMVTDDVAYRKMTLPVFVIVLIPEFIQMLISIGMAGIVLYLACIVVTVHSQHGLTQCIISGFAALLIALNLSTFAHRLESVIDIFMARYGNEG